MKTLIPLLTRLTSVLRRARLEADMREEMSAHVEHRIEEHVAAGLTIEEAKRLTRLDFGNTDRLTEEAREARGWARIDAVRRDLRYAQRQLRRNPLFSILAIGSISVCLGLNSVVLAVLQDLVFRPIPFPQAERIVEIYNSFPKVNIAKLTSNVGQYNDFKTNASAIATAALWRVERDVLTESGRGSRIITASATAEIFDLLSLKPVAGRFFQTENHSPARSRVVVLTEKYWISRHGRDASVIGGTLILNGQPHEIIGVAPQSMDGFDAEVKLIRPFSWNPEQSTLRAGFSPQLFARLETGVSVEQANAQLIGLEHRHYESAAPRAKAFREQTGQTVQVDGLKAQRAKPFRVPLLLLQVSASLLLIVGFSNVLNLVLARTNTRGTEFATRAAIGASRQDIHRQLAAEAAAIGGIGTVGALVLAGSTLPILATFYRSISPSTKGFELGLLPLAMTIGVGALMTTFLALLPRLNVATSAAAAGGLAGRGQSESRKTRSIARLLIITQVAFALSVSVAAAFLGQSFLRAMAVPPGLDPEPVVSLRLDIPQHKEQSLPPRLEEALKALPGIEATVVNSTPFYLIPPFNYSMPLGAVHLAHAEAGDADALPSVFYAGVTPAYADILGLRILNGRWFTDQDYESGRYVVVDEAFRQKHFPNRNPIGERIVINRPPPQDASQWQEIIGVAARVPHNGIEDMSGHPFVYLARGSVPLYGAASVIAKTSRSHGESLTLIRDAIFSLDPEIPVYDANSLADVLSDSMKERRSLLVILSTLAAVCLALTCLGLYGTLAYDVSRRRREIGIRGAIGATQYRLIGMLVRENARYVAIGVFVGLLLAAAGSNAISALLYEVGPTEPLAYVTAVGLVVVAAAFSTLVPAWRASEIDLVTALRSD